MSVLFVLIPLALALVAVFVALYVWSTRSGQFDDLQTPALRALLDERPSRPARAPDEAPGEGAPPASAPDDPATLRR
ncbi:MAG: cbb3-type cytochrome oxidase assembly protein CcoS [Gemmatimonadetes bacterium]|nr:cbb3-type cytochrome oxidase assembly protein CcoS [Gemmatimonadota bacterium]